MAEELQEPRIHPSAKIHKSAVIHPSAKIGEDVRIGPRVKIDAGATIGADTRIDEAAEIGRNVDISNGNVRVGHHARVGDDTRIKSQPRTTRTRAGEYALIQLKNQGNMKTAGLKTERIDMSGRLRWDADGDGKLKVTVDAGHDDAGKPLSAEFTDPEELDRWLDENAPALGERSDPGKGRIGPMQIGDPGPVRKPDYTIGPESRIGNGCTIEAGCHMGANVRIGDNAYLQHNCRLEDDIEIGSVRDKHFEDGTTEMRSTYIGPGTKVEANVQIDEGCWVGAGGHLKADCHLGANTLTENFSTVENGAELPNGSRIGFKQLSKGSSNFDEQVNRARIIGSADGAMHEIQKLGKMRAAGKTGISPEARVDPNAEVHPEATVMAGADIAAGAKIGKGAIIGPQAQVRHDCTVGDRAIIATRATVRDRSHVGENVEIERSCVITNNAKLHDCPAGTRATRIGAETLISGTEIEPAVRIEPGSQTDGIATIHRGALIGAHSRVQGTVGENARVGTDVLLMSGSVVGEKATIGDGAVVWNNSEVEKNAVVEPGRTVPPSEDSDDEHKVRIKAPTAEPNRQENPVRGKGRAVGGTPAPAPSRDHARTR